MVTRDKTLPLLGWLFFLGSLSFVFSENLAVLPAPASIKKDINQARLEDLMVVPRLSFKVARGILKKRSEQGSIADLAVLRQVPGVGAKTLEQLSHYFFVGSY